MATLRRQSSRIGHSLSALLFHPGQLTAEFRDGQRARSISPWRLAFNTVTLFFMLSFVTDFRVANFPRQDPSGTLATAIVGASQRAKVDESVFAERMDRRFNTVFTLLAVLLIGARALLARLTHWRSPEPWGVHVVFALHLTAWTFVATFAYWVALRSFGVPPLVSDGNTPVRDAALAMLALLLLWEFAYVLLAFRRTYGDSWIGAGAKAAVMVVGGVVTANLIVILALWLTLQTI